MKTALEKYIFYLHSPGGIVSESDLPNGYYFKIWRPSIFGFSPKGLSKFPFSIWSIMHYLKLFSNDNYRIFLVYHDKKIIHYSVVLPKHFKYPFMTNSDIQIGPIWTDTEHRRKGIATFTVRKILETYKTKKGRFWYITREENIPSKEFIESLGFSKHGIGYKKSRLGIRSLSYFYIENKY